MKKTQLAFQLTLISTSILSSSVLYANDETNKGENINTSNSIERISIIGDRQDLQKSAGSVTQIDALELEKFEYDDIARILSTVPGVNIRQEDGYGLRPNIGFRGVTPERSKKINIMEDGVLIGPAPYSAPAAYYFPMTSRMSAIEVTKGPSTIKYGPNTVAGALNLVTRLIPDVSEGGLDIGIGTDGYRKANLHYGNKVGDFGYLLEGLHLSADGFKTLDGGGDTGFTKSDLMAKFNYQLNGESFEQLIELKLAYAEETSNETYLGLTDSDFADSPYRRYAASQLDLMEWEHQQIQLTHHIEFENFNATTRLYRNDFERDWFKINGLKSSQGDTPSLQQILTNPTAEAHQTYYQVLTGQRDSTAQEIIVLGSNARAYYSQGVQIDMAWDTDFLGLTHQLEGGFRLHQDQIQRDHTEDNFFMRSAKLESTGENTHAAATNTEETTAYSVYLQNTIELDALKLTAGIRGELIESHYQNRAPDRAQDFQDKTTRIWLPSLSFYYGLNPNSGIFGGMHQGFVPTSPIQSVDIEVEKSTNYELGWRYSHLGQRLELVSFYSDYSNLKESCSNSAGCDTDLEFNAGAVDIYGLEFSYHDRYKISTDYSVPVSVTYTHTQSEFKQSFYSDFEQWGFVNKGDAVPYLAENMLTLSAGLAANDWQISVLMNYTDEMPEAAQTELKTSSELNQTANSQSANQSASQNQQNAALAGLTTDAIWIVDLSASYDLNFNSQIYVKLDNVFESQKIVSRRPYGARPSKPRQFFAGYKYRF